MVTIISKFKEPSYGQRAFKTGGGGQWREMGRRDGKVKMVSPSGEEKIVPIDKEGIKKGWYLQSGNEKEKCDFIETYGYHPQETSQDVKRYLQNKGLLHKWRPDNPNNPDYIKPPAPLTSGEITSIDQI
jgi:hypothetical protein